MLILKSQTCFNLTYYIDSMAELVKPPNKYSPYEWYNSNFKNYSNAEKERATAESIQVRTKQFFLQYGFHCSELLV